MSLVEVKAEIPAGAADAVDTLLLERELSAWNVLEDVIVKRAWVTGIFPDPAAAQAGWAELRPLLPEAPLGEPEIRTLADADWRESYKAHFHAWQFGRLHWVPVWEKEAFALPPGHEVLWLDPGLAFGTGNHETTRLCCERLVEWADRAARAGHGHSVIDAGCGSGILALSAALLNCAPVAAFDLDPEAVRVSHENAELNGLADAVEFAVAGLEDGLKGKRADLVLANIQSDVLRAHARVLLDAVAPGGVLALSGILAQERDAVRDAFAALAPGWQIDSRVMGEWCDVALVRPQ